MDIERQLNSVDVEARREAVLRLVPQESPADVRKNIALLLRAMQDSSWRIRKTAVEILLGEYSVESYVDGLVKLLSLEDNAGARNTAIEALTKLGDRVTDYLVDAFNTENHDVRKFVVDIIGEVRDRKSLPLLIEALRDVDENVRASAVEHLGSMQEASAVDALMEILDGDDLWTAFPAAEALGMIGDRRAVPALVRTLQKKTLREPALKALGRLADPETIGQIAPFIDDKSSVIRQEALQALESMYQNGAAEEKIAGALRDAFGERAIDILLRLASTGRKSSRPPAILFLGLLRDERALSPLLDIGSDEVHAEEVRKALVYIGKEKPEVLLPLFDRDYPYMRRFICEVAAEVASPVYFDIMVRELGDEDGHVRAIATHALANIGDARAISHLFKLLADEYEDVQEAVIGALGRLQEYIELQDVMKLLESKNPVLRRNAALLLGEMGTEAVVKPLSFAQKDESVEVRKAVVSALSKLRSEESSRCITKALTDEDPEIRASAALNLGVAGASQFVEPLCLLLKDAEDMVKVSAARALGNISSQKAMPSLMELLGDHNGFVVTAAIDALGKIGGNDAREAILGMLSSEDAEVKRTAISSLAGFRDVEFKIIPFLYDDDWASRMAAVVALGGRSDENVRKELEKLYDLEQDTVVRKTIEKYLNV